MQKIDKTDTLKTILSGRKYTVDYFQREYRWGQEQIEQVITNFLSGRLLGAGQSKVGSR
jgi:uncharacterized protein with ParB-like and HNH nuclease domain